MFVKLKILSGHVTLETVMKSQIRYGLIRHLVLYKANLNMNLGKLDIPLNSTFSNNVKFYSRILYFYEPINTSSITRLECSVP